MQKSHPKKERESVSLEPIICILSSPRIPKIAIVNKRNPLVPITPPNKTIQ